MDLKLRILRTLLLRELGGDDPPLNTVMSAEKITLMDNFFPSQIFFHFPRQRLRNRCPPDRVRNTLRHLTVNNIVPTTNDAKKRPIFMYSRKVQHDMFTIRLRTSNQMIIR
jgi:hypothetical protein